MVILLKTCIMQDHNIYFSETYPRAVLGKHADLVTRNFSNSSSTDSIIQMPE